MKWYSTLHIFVWMKQWNLWHMRLVSALSRELRKCSFAQRKGEIYLYPIIFCASVLVKPRNIKICVCSRKPSLASTCSVYFTLLCVLVFQWRKKKIPESFIVTLDRYQLTKALKKEEKSYFLWTTLTEIDTIRPLTYENCKHVANAHTLSVCRSHP